jgi:hypothetical protein
MLIFLSTFLNFMVPSKPPKKLLDQCSEIARLKHFSIRTEKAYINWIKRYILFHQKVHPRELGIKEIT